MNDLDKPFSGVYVRAILLEAAVIALLWVIGRMYS